MASDWIKMRIDLQSHPKIVRILSATGADKFRVIGGLHAVWSVFDTHSEDGILRGYTPELMDHIIGWEGFSRAMESVGWLTFDGCDILSMPEFIEHNGKSAKRRAEDQKRKRDSRIESAICPQSVRKNSEEKRTREREDKEVNNTPPDGLDLVAWNSWVEYRAKIKKPIKPASFLAAQKKLAGYGLSQFAVVEQSIANGWQGLFDLKAGQVSDPSIPKTEKNFRSAVC